MLNEIKTSFGNKKKLGVLYAEAFSRWTEGLLGGSYRKTWPRSDPRFAKINPKKLFDWLDKGTFTFYGFNGTTRPFDICDPVYGVKPDWEE